MIRQWNYFDFCWIIFPKKFFGDSTWPADIAGEDQEKGERERYLPNHINLIKWYGVKDIGRPFLPMPLLLQSLKGGGRLWTGKRKEDAPSELWILQKLDHIHCNLTKRYVMDMRGERRRVEEGPPRKWYNNHSYCFWLEDIYVWFGQKILLIKFTLQIQWDLIVIDGPPSQYKYKNPFLTWGTKGCL